MATVPFLSEERVTFYVYDENDVLVWTKQVDVSLNENHTKEMLITDHPTSKGIPVTDNIKAKARPFAMVAMFTDHPVRPDEVVRKLTAGESANETYAQLEEIQDKQSEGWRFRIKTSLRVYDNMVLQKMDVPRNAEKGSHVEVSMVFKEIRKATSKKVGVPKRKTKQAKNTKGKQTKIKPKPEKGSSLLFKGVKKLSEKFGVGSILGGR